MINNDIIEALQHKDENFAGYIKVGEKTMFGTEVNIVAITKLTENEITEIVKNEIGPAQIQLDRIEANVPEHQGSQQGDEVKQLFMGRIETKHLIPNNEYKLESPDDMTNVKEWYREFRFLSPIIVDRNLKIIDGNVRLQIAINSETEYVSVVVLDTDKVKSDGLRLALNRTSEFQRWNYDDVDRYVDSKPQLQPILEPIGFFSNTVLPVSFFSGTVINYEKDMYNDQQQKYMQDKGLEEWASIMRHRHEKLEKIRSDKQKDYSRHKGLLSIEFDESDLRETYNPEEVTKENLDSMVTIADRVTKNFDKARKEEIEEKGLKWQNTRRSSKQKAADKRAEATQSKKKGE